MCLLHYAPIMLIHAAQTTRNIASALPQVSSRSFLNGVRWACIMQRAGRPPKNVKPLSRISQAALKQSTAVQVSMACSESTYWIQQASRKHLRCHPECGPFFSALMWLFGHTRRQKISLLAYLWHVKQSTIQARVSIHQR